MKRRIFIAVILLISLISAGCSSNNLDKKLEEAFEGYVQYIKEFVANSEYDIVDMVKYDLAFINDDEIPELVISTGEAHASGVRICFFDQENKKVVDTGESYCQNGDLDSYYERKSCIFDYYFGNGGYFNVCFCRIGAAPEYKVTKSRCFTNWSDDNGDSHYAIDFDEVSKEEYDKAYSEDAPEFVNEEKKSLEREEMRGDYQTCSQEDALGLFYKMIE